MKTAPTSGTVVPPAVHPMTGPGPWMREVLRAHARARRKPGRGAVHDLRVALRRCRTLADACVGLDPKSRWQEMDRAARGLFKPVGGLRDVQVQLRWIQRLGLEDIPDDLLRMLRKQERKSKKRAERALGKFPKKEWERLARFLEWRWEMIGPAPGTVHSMALARLDEALALHRLASHRRSRESWHRLRIAIKRLRYTVENFLPAPEAERFTRLAAMQDSLGEAQDLAMLMETVRHCPDLEPGPRQALRVRIDRERRRRLQDYRKLATGPDAPWKPWREAL